MYRYILVHGQEAMKPGGKPETLNDPVFVSYVLLVSSM